MISHKHKFIFIHVPKTAGTSIEKALRDESCQLLPGEWATGRSLHAPLNHLTLQELVDYGALTPAQLKSYFKFCFVRNPWDRLISEVFCRWMAPWFKDLAVDERIRRACELAATPTGIGNHLRPQAEFVRTDTLQMDFIGRFEHLEEDFAQVCRLLGIDASLPHLNHSAHRPFQEYYNAETQALAASSYRRDIEAFHYTFDGALDDQEEISKATQLVSGRVGAVRGQTKIIAYSLVEHPVPLQPAPHAAVPVAVDVNRSVAGVGQLGWHLCCPVAFTATWNGGNGSEDIEIRLEGTDCDQPAFVQSNRGGGVLTFYPGYQFKTDASHSLWVRGPVNTPKDGLHPLESLVDASLLPCTVAVHWQFTRPNQTIRFAAGEPFATLLLYPKAGLDAMSVTIVHADVHADDGEDAYAEDFQQMAAAPGLQALFQRLGAPAVEPSKPAPKLRER